MKKLIYILLFICAYAQAQSNLTITRKAAAVPGGLNIQRAWFTDVTPIDIQGQSNADGRIAYASYPSTLQDSATFLKAYWQPQTTLKKVIAGRNTSYIRSAEDSLMTGLDVVLQDYLQFINKRFYIIKRTKGGVPLCPYTPSSFNYSTGVDANVTNSHAIATGVGNEYAQFIWMQGETEANDTTGGSSCANNYATYLADMITDFRGIVGTNVHVIIPRVNTDLNAITYPNRNIVSNAQITAAANVGHAHTFSTAGLGLIDAVHFNLAAYHTIASQVAELIRQDVVRPRLQ